MAKIIDYPRASLKNSLGLAEAIDQLGGSCSTELAADKLGKQLSGAFSALIGAAVKYQLITSKKGQLSVTQLYRDMTLAYTQEEANARLQTAFLAPPLFRAVFDRFENKPLPVSHFEKLLIREFDVPGDAASRLSTYFLDGAKQCGLIGENHVLQKVSPPVANSEDLADVIDEKSSPAPNTAQAAPQVLQLNQLVHSEDDSIFSVRIKGPGMDSLIVINDEDDLDIVQVMLKKVRRKLEISEFDE